MGQGQQLRQRDLDADRAVVRAAAVRRLVVDPAVVDPRRIGGAQGLRRDGIVEPEP